MRIPQPFRLFLPREIFWRVLRRKLFCPAVAVTCGVYMYHVCDMLRYTMCEVRFFSLLRIILPFPLTAGLSDRAHVYVTKTGGSERERERARARQTDRQTASTHLLECLPGAFRCQRRLISGRGHELLGVPSLFLDVGQLRVHDLVPVATLLHDRIVLHLWRRRMT